ncbi:MAG: hypothetical protein KDB31_12495, partial [Microthrixaceae bacterium]|nr:hypothetical protein [Microthrixaceae bacterium]
MATRPSTPGETVRPTTARPPGPSGVRVVVVSHGPPMRGGIATVATDIVEDPSLCSEFEVVFVNTSQNDEARGDFAWANVVRAFGHAARTFVAARRGA